MGEIKRWSQMGGGGRLLPNGLLPNAAPLIESLDSEIWLKAEERTAELITFIQPNQPSEERRNAVADYVQRLIMKCFPCQVFTFGSVPLKTYLPDGDIDLTAFSNNPNLKDSWATEVRDLLETEEKNENAQFHVKEVQYIQAEVKIIKCLVENIVVDISFNQLGGLCTLCFLEEVDNLINQNHLFKRSIILIKAWCYYESRILGAHHGLISTYALETLVLYIFHVFNNSFAGPLEVLYRFLEFFSNFDWDNFCVSLWGPVPISSLPDVIAEPPRKDSGELFLNKVFLDACSSVYAIFLGGQDNQGQTFLLKHFNVIDPLRVGNNLGRSVSKGNFFRIRSAFAFGAKRLARLLDCPKENLVAELNQFFTNTWDRHGNGIRPDAPVSDSLILNRLRASNSVVKEQNSKSGHLANDIQRSPFARTRSSPKLTDKYKSCTKPPENEKNFEGLVESNGDSNMHQEEKDLVNMASSAFHMPMNVASGHLPFPISSSFLGYAQSHLARMVPANMPVIDPAFSGMQFPPQLTHYFSEDAVNENNLVYADINSGNSEIVLEEDDKPQPSSTRMNYVPPPLRVGGSGGLITSQQKNNKEKHDQLRDNHLFDHSQNQENDDYPTALTFYPTGPPGNGSSNASASHFDECENFSLRGVSPGETSSDEHKCDILDSDFASHWQNLQFGRFCQSPHHHYGPTVYHSPVYVHPGRPLPSIMNYGPQLVPNRPLNVYVEDLPRYRSGTGTYLPNPKVAVRERHFYREGKWNVNTKSRGSNRKSTNRLDRLGSSGSWLMNSQGHESFSTYESQNGVSHPSSSQSGPADGSNGPAVMMVYPFELSHNEQHGFGSFSAQQSSPDQPSRRV